jgi:hypothetical protein
MKTLPFLTIGDVAKHFGCEAWKVRRVYERGLLPPAARVGAYRVIFPAELPLVEAALRKLGYLPAEASCA